jgi:BMFP domain-containing protein YqiC
MRTRGPSVSRRPAHPSIMADDVTIPTRALDWLWSLGGLMAGSGAVWGSVRTRLGTLEKRLEALEAQQRQDTDDRRDELGALRTELRGDLREMAADIKDYVRDILSARGPAA